MFQAEFWLPYRSIDPLAMQSFADPVRSNLTTIDSSEQKAREPLCWRATG
jgi:hypothetical protein